MLVSFAPSPLHQDLSADIRPQIPDYFKHYPENPLACLGFLETTLLTFRSSDSGRVSRRGHIIHF